VRTTELVRGATATSHDRFLKRRLPSPGTGAKRPQGRSSMTARECRFGKSAITQGCRPSVKEVRPTVIQGPTSFDSRSDDVARNSSSVARVYEKR